MGWINCCPTWRWGCISLCHRTWLLNRLLAAGRVRYHSEAESRWIKRKWQLVAQGGLSGILAHLILLQQGRWSTGVSSECHQRGFMASFLWAFIEQKILEHRSLSIQGLYLQDFETHNRPRRAPGMAVQSWAALATAVVSITAVLGLCPRHWETHRSRSRRGEFEIDHRQLHSTTLK